MAGSFFYFLALRAEYGERKLREFQSPVNRQKASNDGLPDLSGQIMVKKSFEGFNKKTELLL
jgi:hypothetical protein